MVGLDVLPQELVPVPEHVLLAVPDVRPRPHVIRAPTQAVAMEALPITFCCGRCGFREAASVP